MTHSIFTIRASIVPERQLSLESYLAAIRAAVPNHPDLPFACLRKLHFASIIVVPAEPPFPAYVVLENNVDGTIAAYLDDLCAIAARGLDTIFAHCSHYGPAATPTASVDVGRLRAFLWNHLCLPDAAFVGNVGRSVERIGRERDLVETLGREADRLVATGAPPAPEGLYRALRAHVAATEPWALQPKARLSARELAGRRFRLYGPIALAVVLALELLPVSIVASIWFLTALRARERKARPLTAQLSTDVANAKMKYENLFYQNHFASISTVEPGRFRRRLLRIVLWTIGRFAKTSVDGTLSGLDNIHFAHWVLVDDGRRLLFVTNYDGSWENYLDDFIDKAATGLTAIWSNVRGFPRTRYLAFGGATDERTFKNIARSTQIPSAVWYSAYPQSSVPSIDNNSALRDGLTTPPRGAALDRWLQRL